MRDFNKGRYGYVDFIAHGHYGGISTYITPGVQDHYGINALDNDKAWLLEEIGNGLDCQTNFSLPSWSVSISCELGNLSSYYKTMTFPESYLFGGKYGGVVFICNSGPGYFLASSRLSQSVFNVVRDSYSGGLTIPYAGYADQKGKLDYFSTYKDYSVIGHLYVTGDPLVMLWAKSPRSSVIENGVNKIDGLTSNDFVYVGLNNLSNGRTIIDKQQLSIPISINPLSNEIRTYYRSDTKPFIVPANLSNRLFEANGYTIGGEINIIREGSKSTAIELLDDIDYTIESLSNINVRGDIKGNPNSALRLKSRENIFFSDCTLQSGSSVICEKEGEILFDRGFTIVKGGSIIVN